MTNRKQKPIPDFETRAAAAQQMAVELRDTQPFNDEYLYRTYEVDRAAIDIDKRTVESWHFPARPTRSGALTVSKYRITVRGLSGLVV